MLLGCAEVFFVVSVEADLFVVGDSVAEVQER